jgi:bacteriocin-like protein
MSEIEHGPTARVLQDDELAQVSGGFHEVDKRGSNKPLNPLVIYGFNPQPDPPGMMLVG